MKNYNILITSAGKRVELVRYFMEALTRLIPGAKVYTTDMLPVLAPAGYVSDGCIKVPRVTSEGYRDVLLNICEGYKIGMIVPTIDPELLVLSRQKELFKQKGVHVIVPDADFVAFCRDKRKTISFFESHLVRTPKLIDITHPVFPLVAKPFDGSSSVDVHYIKSAASLTPDIMNDPKYMFMEYIDKRKFKEYTVDMYYGRDGHLKCSIPRERIEVRAGEINKGRTQKYFLVDYVKEHLGHLEGCSGVISFQLFFCEEKNDVVGIEINPRFGGGYPLSYHAGGNYPEMLIREYFLEESIDYFDDWKDGLLMLRYDDAVFV